MSYQVDCPSNTYLCRNNMKKIYGNLKTLVDDNIVNNCTNKFSTYTDNDKILHRIEECKKDKANKKRYRKNNDNIKGKRNH